ncbi:hypothetical protein A3F08_01040 [Candidatus Berkelbacteria bacterium RIFCSPHIGHO2_12_FULL_36_9]|uniref:HTH cro/C1-type domain-containing protein n=1 Tax=Candidatus Berkelbacteria bacterium RIFCSPHIGHO2_12_FULL_36_9 TaxID=1797469 RepID=A0A1F5EF48_9BACT|nr:MAG: hypothetical protein A3F08_01040 [Candidatus Berkelbacteria bacterium RIFCSPHIGHO2_12_FULL_36_9]
MTAFFTKKKIRLEKSYAQKLISARKKANLNLEDVEKETKISMKYLFALEYAQYDKLPADVYVVGFLKRYADFLKIKNDLVKQYLAEKNIAKTVSFLGTKSVSENVVKLEPSKKLQSMPKFFITPELVISFCIGVVVIGLLGYIWFQVKSFAAAPPLELKNEAAEIVISMETINIEGKTDSGAILTINGQPVAVDSNGNFVQIVQLIKGINTIEIIAKNKADKETKKVIQILSK